LGPHTHKGTRSTFGRVKGITYFNNIITHPKEVINQIEQTTEENIQDQWEAPVSSTKPEEPMLYPHKRKLRITDVQLFPGDKKNRYRD